MRRLRYLFCATAVLGCSGDPFVADLRAPLEVTAEAGPGLVSDQSAQTRAPSDATATATENAPDVWSPDEPDARNDAAAFFDARSADEHQDAADVQPAQDAARDVARDVARADKAPDASPGDTCARDPSIACVFVGHVYGYRCPSDAALAALQDAWQTTCQQTGPGSYCC